RGCRDGGLGAFFGFGTRFCGLVFGCVGIFGVVIVGVAGVLLGGSYGGIDGVAPLIGAEGVDVFVLGELDGIDHGLSQVGQGGGGFALDAALGDATEDLA